MLDEKDLQAIAQLVKQVVSDELEPIKQDIKDIKKNTVRIERKMDSGISYLDACIEKLDRKLTYETTMLKKTDIAIMQDMEHLTV